MIPRLYKCRWKVESFFQWIEQQLRIEAFYGTTENAAQTQVWIAIGAEVLVAIIEEEPNVERSLYYILQILTPTFLVEPPEVLFARRMRFVREC